MVYAVCLDVGQREHFNELANRDLNAERLRGQFNQQQWMSNEIEIFWITNEQKEFILNNNIL